MAKEKWFTDKSQGAVLPCEVKTSDLWGSECGLKSQKWRTSGHVFAKSRPVLDIN